MGEYADMVLEGLIDGETGELIDGDAPGYPRSASQGSQRKLRRLLNDATSPKTAKAKCPTCGKRVKAVGLEQHIRDVHGK